jgi:hypothetical protein
MDMEGAVIGVEFFSGVALLGVANLKPDLPI